ncbi:MAG: hypothetical protein AAF740_08795, partial [Bacteroidota bacterium]
MMKIKKPFNQCSISQYKHYIDNYKKYKNFNPLGLYRSILENDKLSLEEQIEVRDHAHETFKKTFDFYPLKDPVTYFELNTLGEELTQADENQFWEGIREKQQRILKRRQIKHRNFGVYSKHLCGYTNCSLDGIMLRQGSWFADSHMYF